jgi:hypothetical protein
MFSRHRRLICGYESVQLLVNVVFSIAMLTAGSGLQQQSLRACLRFAESN